jgi:S-methylmethionine-dependent homocysteine/selenocysteine methylase
MPRWRDELPQLSGRPFLTDGGIETTLIFHEGLALPDFAAFHLLREPAGEETLRKYYRPYADIAARSGTGLILESATWRASADWGARLGYTATALARANRRALAMLEALREEYETDATPVVVSGCVGPRGDGYVPGAVMSEAEAEAYHRPQVEAFADAGADMVCAITMNYTAEAVGVARAARAAGVPVAISFTLETDGRLPTGQALADAVGEVDAATGRSPSYYMLNCAHPTHIEKALTIGGSWLRRIRGLRANASRMSHAELNEAPELDAGDPAELGREYAALVRRLPALNVLGGCCGTDHRHVERIAAACLPLLRRAA